jgi:hypothetical protein
MSTAQQTIHYDLAREEDLDRLLEEFPDIEARAVIVAFDATGDYQPTDLSLARLVACARNFNKRLIVESSDRELSNRAMRLGFDDLAVLSDTPPFAIKDKGAIAPVIIARLDQGDAAKRFTTTASLSTYRPANVEPDADSAGSEDEVDAVETESTIESPPESASGSESETAVIDASRVRGRPETDAAPESAESSVDNVSDVQSPHEVGAPTQVHGPKRTPSPVQAADDEYEPPRAAPSKRTYRSRRGRRRKGLILAAAVISPLIVIAVVGALAVYLLPTAEVSIVPVENTITSSLTYGVQTADASFDIAVEPTLVTNTSSSDATREATGERYEPDGTASGPLQITNPFMTEVTVPAGTDIGGSNGITYFTGEDLVIPAADPFGSLSFGSATVSIYAGIAGPDGNLDAGALTGQLGTGLFYTNPSPISGGTMRSISVIHEDDVAAVLADVEQALVEKAEDEFLRTIADDVVLIPDSVEILDPEVEVFGEAGTDGTEVSASGTITVRGRVFDPEELHERALEEAGRLLASQGGGDRIVLASTVDIADPVALNDEQTAFSVRANASARTVISEEEKQELIESLAGKSRSEAEDLLESHPKIARYDLVIEPDWLPDRLPEITSRIELHVSTGEQTATSR